ncbi:MAG: SMI1/KNR4 family protein [Anaerolineaceae bacterium]|nr:SMI1/KNR4 family protein [Anaerolineaceae bacterium]
MTGQIPKLLDTLRTVFISRGCDVDRHLQPGLSREEIATKTSQLAFNLPEELIDLYTWRNGQRSDAEYEAEALRFRDNSFISLERGLAEYDEVRQYYGSPDFGKAFGFDLERSIPFASFEGAWYVLICGSHKLKSPHPHPVVSVFEGIDLSFHSFRSMLNTCIAWVGDPRWTKDSGLGLDPEIEHKIWKDYNPGIFE